MTNTKNTKRALLSSVVALFLCFAMLLGTTFAWFTDSVASANNIITAGNLNIELYHTDNADKRASVNGNTTLFDDVVLWEPGAVAYETFEIANEGTLALNYQLAVNVANATKTANGGTLADVLKVGVIENGATATTREEMIKEVTTWNSLASFALPGDLEKGEADTYTVVIYWQPSDVDNAYNMNNGEAALTIDIGVNLYATQKMSENDSFGNNYDAEAPMPEVITTADDLAAALTANEKEITVALYADIDLPISSLGQQTGGSGEYKLGGEDTESIVIDLNGHKLNITTTYWSNIGAKNADATMTIKNGTMTSSQPTGTWNSYDLNFSNCNYVFENVTFDKAVALANTGKSVEMTNVTINETHDYYALWISAEGMDVEINGLTINSLGRGIKIDEQYVNAPAKVTLNVTNADFNTAKKAAIVVKSAAGADINLANVDFANTIDTVHAVWVDEDAAAYADLVTVTGGEKANEAEVATDLADLQSKINDATDGAYIEIVNDIAGNVTVAQKADTKITIDGNNKTFAGVLLVDGKSATYTTAGLTIQNLVFKADSISADACIQLGKDNNTRYTCNVTIDNCTFDVPGAVGVKSYTGGDKNLVIKNSTATANAHSLVQAKGIDGILVEKCTVNSKNGLNFNNSTNVTVDNCTVDVKGYAVRFGESSGGEGAAEVYLIKNCSLKSANDDGDATIILRGTADYSTLTIENTTIVGTPDITNTATGATVVK